MTTTMNRKLRSDEYADQTMIELADLLIVDIDQDADSAEHARVRVEWDQAIFGPIGRSSRGRPYVRLNDTELSYGLGYVTLGAVGDLTAKFRGQWLDDAMLALPEPLQDKVADAVAQFIRDFADSRDERDEWNALYLATRGVR